MAHGRAAPLHDCANACTLLSHKTFEEAFPDGIREFDRPTNVLSGPDGCAYVADYGAVRDFGRSDPDAGFKKGADAALEQIPATGVIWKICPQ
jgi:hypothetical protein